MSEWTPQGYNRMDITIADLFNVPPHLIADLPRHRYTWRVRRWLRRVRR